MSGPSTGKAADASGAGEPGRRSRRPHRRVTRPATNEDAAPAEGQTGDDLPSAWGEGEVGPSRDEWLAEQRPPHWG